MYSRSSEPVQFERDCAAVLVPQGDSVTLPAGSFGYITQALGGSYTVFVEGNLFRIAGQDGDVLGKEPAESLSLPDNASDDEVELLVWKQLRTCFDPEIPFNIVDLGLVYDLSWDEENTALVISMTLTSAGCPLTDVIEEQIAESLDNIVEAFRINWVWMPPWGPERITDDGREMMRARGFSI